MSTIGRHVIPSFPTKAEVFEYLRINCDKIQAEKKSFPVKSENFNYGYSLKKNVFVSAANAIKKSSEGVVNADEIDVDIIANLSGWCDSYDDVMIKDSWKKSINDIGASGQKIVYHLKNHNYNTDSIIGKDSSLYSKMIDLSIFNLESDVKNAQALMMASTVMREYDPKCFMLYRDKQVKQHSIGLQYVKLYMCMNSDESEDSQYKDNWDKYYPQVINKDKVDAKGYFWAVVEAKILEVSVVLYGANELTNDLTGSDSKGSTQSETEVTTQDEPPEEDEEEKRKMNWEKMASAFNY